MSNPPHPYAHTLSAALAPPRETPADHADRLERVPQLFLDALFIAFQSEKGRAGFAEDLRWCAGLCTVTWGEEALWNGMVHVQRGMDKRTHLMYAAAHGDVERVRWLLARGAPTELADSIGGNACIWASCMGHADVVRALIAAGANVRAAGHDGETALFSASDRGHVEVVRVLLAAGADIDAAQTSDLTTSLGIATSAGHIEVVRMLLAAGADVTHADTLGRTALHLASIIGHVEVIRALLAAGADMNALVAAFGLTPLHFAVEYGKVDAIRELLTAGADATRLDNAGRTARQRLAATHPMLAWPAP
jgi:ankyrin repeat protein